MADEQEPKTEPEEEPKTEHEEEPKGGDGKPIMDSHGQEGISKAKYERERREWEAKVADLKAQLDDKAEDGDRVAKLEADLKAMQDRLADEKLTASLAAAGCVNAKAAKAVLGDYDGDVDKLKADCPYLFAQKKQTGSTGGAPAGAPKADEIAKARAAAGLPPKK
jgi:molecular chaperone GrpE (heat shock protein)